ncbi:TetR family transcriptional regulator [Mycolicibacterium wolinskyi]|uniref:TetR family transcriptional regulator n=1 Tax=Mycolicibacterium wolinskyi TaxID=59750 RepID=A0A1X2EYK1_9MYCO|nr:TetR family transcriptional regulator [Mycolicibacterium wolinskyi]MCV7292325.1 TetR family transcriptional regulator [Mycolicibacterium goodii]ORX11227.1 TetR family transcriptional regulator [Mycolicibacterium wolinskyi]
MAPPRKHETDVILDAARALVLADGPRAASVAAIAKVSGAPAGTLYHRFGNRNGILTAAWLRSLERFQSRAMAGASEPALESAVSMAVAAVRFARDVPDDARLLLTIRPADLLDGEPDADFQARLAAMNAPLIERLRELARGIYGDDGPRTMDAMARAVVDLPYAVVRRHAHDAELPAWLEEDLADAVRKLLSVNTIVTASREIAAPAGAIFELIADPAQQPRWDGNDNLADAPAGQRVHAVGDVFTMNITQGSARENHVVEFEEGRRIAWRPSEPGAEPPGHLWRWELAPLDAGRTLVTHTYDWSQLTDEKRLVRARATTAEKLQSSIDRLAAIAEGR